MSEKRSVQLQQVSEGNLVDFSSDSNGDIMSSNQEEDSHTWRYELCGPQRLWTTTLGALIASLSPLLGGYTLGFASPALLELNDDHVPTEYRLEGFSWACLPVRH